MLALAVRTTQTTNPSLDRAADLPAMYPTFRRG